MKILTLSAILLSIPLISLAQSVPPTRQETGVLKQLSMLLDLENKKTQQELTLNAERIGWPTFRKSSYGNSIKLKGMDTMGFPVYMRNWNNILSAETTQTNALQPGGTLNLNLSGASANMSGKLAIWDEGIMNWQHQEFAGKNIIRGDDATNIEDHATHVAGTMIAKGLNPLSKGMAFGATDLYCYDYNNDQSEMANAASHLLISNHSYGYQAGWSFDSAQIKWIWEGLPGDTVDYKFGFYGTDARNYDQISFYAPYYLIVQAAGNSHSETGPPPGYDYYGYQSRKDPTLVLKGPRPSGISYNDAYDVITGTANSKNNLTVGAVYPIPNGPTTPGEVKIAPFSSWGPTDDGRIKPDICGNGIFVLSTGANSNNSYYTSSGTSTATANVSGSLFLLQEYYSKIHQGKFMRSATLKALVCHTALDAGNPGPDYVYGWGLLNTAKAAQVIGDQSTNTMITEQTLTQGEIQTLQVSSNNGEPLVATIAWTDPAGNPNSYGVINDRTPKLVNDLDLRISDGSISYLPWILDPENPTSASVTGDNIRDNIEQVFIKQPKIGTTYTISVSHKKRLTYGLQNYSLIVTGIQSASELHKEENNISLLVFPVPASSELNVTFNSPSANNLSITLMNALGQKVYDMNKQIPNGAYIMQIDTSKLANGMFELQLKYGNSYYYKKLIINN